MPDTETTRTRSTIVRHVRAASRAELERRVLTLQPAHDALLAELREAAAKLTDLSRRYVIDDYEKAVIHDRVQAARAAIAAASEAGS